MQRITRTQFASLLLVAGISANLLGLLDAAEWTRFRGPDGSAVSDETGLPTEWSAEKNVVWRTKLPGPGTSSPIVLGKYIYLTSYSGYALSREEPGDMSSLMRHVVCIDRASGEKAWSKEFEPKLPESAYSGGNNSWHGYASSTPATDGEFLYVFFGKSGVYCLDLEGNTVWHTEVGDKTAGWGSANSLVIHKDVLIVNASIESTRLVGLDKATGKEVWSVPGIRGSRNTPILVDVPGGQTELVVGLPQKILGIDPTNGEQLWECEGIPDRGYVCPSVVAHNGIVYAVGGRKNTALAVRAGGQGDVTGSHLLWKTNKGTNVSSPVYLEGFLYWYHERGGTAYCLNAENGELAYRERLSPQPGTMYSSIMAADGKLYCVSQRNGTYVLAAKPEFELLAHNVFAGDDSRTNACPVAHNSQLLLRNDTYLYCLDE